MKKTLLIYTLFLICLAFINPSLHCDDNDLASSYEIYSAPVQAVRTGISPCVLAVSVLAIVGASALILSSGTSSSSHSANP